MKLQTRFKLLGRGERLWFEENKTRPKNKDEYESPDDDGLKQKPGKRHEGRENNDEGEKRRQKQISVQMER